MRAVKVDLGNNPRVTHIHILADWHIGDRHCDMGKIRAQLKEIEADPAAYIILNGDLCNNATKASVSDSYAEVLTPMEQIGTVVGLLQPLKHKILLATQGNHEARTYRSDGVDLTYLIMKELGLEDKYVREGGVLFVRTGQVSNKHKRTGHENEIRKVCYSFYVTHGSGGGRKEGSKAVRLADMASTIDTDIYVHSHTHLPMIMKEKFYRIDCRNSTFADVEKLFVNTAASLNYGGYGQTFEFKPSSLRTPVIHLSGTKKEFCATL